MKKCNEETGKSYKKACWSKFCNPRVSFKKLLHERKLSTRYKYIPRFQELSEYSMMVLAQYQNIVHRYGELIPCQEKEKDYKFIKVFPNPEELTDGQIANLLEDLTEEANKRCIYKNDKGTWVKKNKTEKRIER